MWPGGGAPISEASCIERCIAQGPGDGFVKRAPPGFQGLRPWPAL